jgi:hypothetical protein
MTKSANPEETADTLADVRLQQLLHLKRYETPAPSRMVRSKQNIMRQVRESASRRRWSLGDLLEMNIPWFFAEPRYGIAALFIVFAGLQFLGSSQKQSRTGIYTSPAGKMAAYESDNTTYTNQFAYPRLPSNVALFPDQQTDSNVKFVGRIEEK